MSSGRGKGEAGSVLHEATAAVAKQLGAFTPRAAVVLGSGLGFLADEVQSAIRIPYAEIPGFPQPGVAGHQGELVAGTLGGVPVIAQSGRFHLYEGYPAQTAALPVRVFGDLGIRTLILTNAAGGVRLTFRPPTLMLIADHINFMWRNPLLGPVEAGEERFPDMSQPYDAELRTLAREVARAERVTLEEGVYAGLLGPSYETPAEVRMFKTLGADAVGMSTVPEVIVARARGLRVMAVSTITNYAAGLTAATLNHAEVLTAANQVAAALGRLVKGVLTRI